MIFKETKLKGAFLIKPEQKEDERGFFARTFCMNQFMDYDLLTSFVQSAVSFNKKKGTLRGMHFQRAPFEEAKIVTCTLGSVLDIIVDIRPSSPTFLQHVQVELSQENGYSLYVPKSFAHGFFTLQDASQVSYQMTQFHHSESEGGFRYDDPAINIPLPSNVMSISERDRTYPDLVKEILTT
ncbi:dTDP-4-dehydrorhamnose 3,5-epimerase [soil metagenome]